MEQRQNYQIKILGNPPRYWFFMTPPPKRQIFQWTPKILKFFILLKVNKLLLKMSQFEFLVMIEKKIFTYKVFLSLNILDFNLFFMWQLQPPWKSHPTFFHRNPPLKVEVPPPPLPPSERWGVCTLWEPYIVVVFTLPSIDLGVSK